MNQVPYVAFGEGSLPQKNIALPQIDKHEIVHASALEQSKALAVVPSSDVAKSIDVQLEVPDGKQDNRRLEVVLEKSQTKEHAIVSKTEDSVGLIVEAEHQVAQLRIEETDDGQIEVNYIFYRTFLSLSYQARFLRPIEEMELTSGEKCADCCCQAYSCFGVFRSSKPHVASEYSLTPCLKRARTLGTKEFVEVATDFGRTIYTGTPVGLIVKGISIYAPFIFSLVNLIKASVALSMKDDGNDSHGVIRKLKAADIAFIIATLVFATLDILLHLKQHRCYKACCEFCRDVTDHREATDPKPSTCKSCYAVAKKNRDELGPGEEKDDEAEDHEKCKKLCTCCPTKVSLGMDIARIFFLDLMFYPQLLISVFMLLTCIILNHGDAPTTAYIGIVLATLQKAFGVYAVRVFVLVGTIFSVQSVRRAEGGKKLKGAAYHCLFVVNCIGQMAVQILMIIAIGARFYREFDKFIHTDTSSSSRESFPASGQLYYMMVYGYCAPVLGIFMFLFIHHFWTQEFPIKFLITTLKSLKKPGLLSSIKQVKGFKERLHDVMQATDVDNLNEDYKNWSKLGFTSKMVYPFYSPIHSIISLVYCGSLTAFVLCAAIDGFNTTGWIVFYVGATVFTAAVNGYVAMVAMFWAAIFVVIVLLIALIILFFILAICLSNNDRRRCCA